MRLRKVVISFGGSKEMSIVKYGYMKDTVSILHLMIVVDSQVFILLELNICRGR